jgi:5-formyltetrahydrofolate cyclo-ligase
VTNGSANGPAAAGAAPATKAELRRRFRSLRRGLTDTPDRSARVAEHLLGLPALAALRRDGAGRVLLYTALPGEPQLATVAASLRDAGLEVRVPEDEPDPDWPEVVVVPGLAFTPAGDRLGQGGGWYDRFLAGIRSECVTIGVGFDVQIVDRLPIEDHDVRLDHLVTDTGVRR